MIFDAKCKSFKILVVVLGLIGATLVADCQAERNPISPVSLINQNRFQAFASDKAVAQLEAFKRDRKRNEKRWSELKRFVGLQVTAASNRLVSSGLSDWWTQRVSPGKKPMVCQQASDQSIAISPMALIVKLTGNMSPIQWWQVSRKTASWLKATQEGLVQNSTKFQAELQTSLLQLAKTSLVQKANEFAASSFVQAVFVIDLEKLASKSKQVLENVNEVTSADAYWSYYSDCDFWGVELNPADEE